MSSLTDNHTPLPRLQSLRSYEDRLMQYIYVNGEVIAYGTIFILAILSRFWDLGVRVMSHDESLHTRYSWLLYQGEGFSHTPLMHGPLLFHMTALSYLLFGDNDFSARIYTAVLGVLIVMAPMLMRKWLGRTGAIAASAMILISPLLLYYSRYIRHDIPAIFAAIMMAVAIWRYMEDRSFKWLVWLALGQVILFASKEVSFIYVAIFGSYLTLYFLTRLMDAPWRNPTLRKVYVASVIATLFFLLALVVEMFLTGRLMPAAAAGTIEIDPAFGEITFRILLGLLIAAIVVVIGSVVLGQWKQLRDYPELDVMIVMGSLVLPSLSPFIIHFAGFDPMDETPAGISRSTLFTLPVLAISITVGMIWGMLPPKATKRPALLPAEGEEEQELKPDFLDWAEALLTSRWLVIAAVYWLIYVFFFTTMFTNGAGLGTGVIGSLGYWLEQHGVHRAGQPWYYYIGVIIPIYEFLPLILTLIAATTVFGGTLIRRLRAAAEQPSDIDPQDSSPLTHKARIDLAEPIEFPVLGFIGYWIIVNFIAYSIAGEKMPWLGTHLTLPMILLGGWVLGRAIDRIRWDQLRENYTWLLLPLIPVVTVALLRVAAPGCSLWEANPLCNTIIPESYQQGLFAGRTIEALSTTYGWLAAVLVLAGTVYALIALGTRVGFGQVSRLIGLSVVGSLVFLTIRTSWFANYINYDYANEYLVYAHSAGSVKDVLDQIEEISLKTTDGMALKVAYDNKVSWPISWYMREYPNAVYFGDQPSRGLVGDAPVILAGPDNWTKVESLLNDRYYRFEYIRMWWPMEDYKGLETFDDWKMEFRDILTDPLLQRGIWDIFIKRDYTTYAEAVMPYRGLEQPPSFELSEWPVADRMRVYIRKDTYAQVWEYGVSAAEFAEVIDPYSQNIQQLQPVNSFGEARLNKPHGLAFGPDGNLYVANSQNHQIIVFSPDGDFVRSFASQGLAPAEGKLNEPWDVAIADNGDVYVADTWNHRVVVFTQEGQFIRQWGFEGPNQTDDPYALWGPRGITVRGDEVYIADTGNKRIQVFNLEGEFLRQIGTGGTLIGQVDEPVGLAFGPNNTVYVADTWNQRIQVFNDQGLYVNQWNLDAWFAQTNERPYIAINSNGLVYVTDPGAFRVIVFNSLGEYVYSFGDFETITSIGAITIGPDGFLYITDVEGNQVQRYDISTMPTTPFIPPAVNNE